MSDDADNDAAVDALLAVAAPAFNAKASPYFTEVEAENLKAEAQTLWSNGHWLRTLLQDHGGRLRADDPGTRGPTLKQLDEALAAIIVASARIGAASVIHPANKRHINSLATKKSREGKARTSRQIKRDRIKKTVLPPLLARGASRLEILLALNDALKAEGAGVISQAGADRWKLEVLAMGPSSETSD
ncbi:hypothetical protein [Methylobacterium radiotolerans]|uniref:hypothetical protein n=1 Tax=Methylobacterium radiotolerans TaxID=31998 RepID=UPI001190978E|nr:hypothetical protein [Methylobacterium radiotolerans]GEM97454.1 hypothetical protein MRA01_19940 [Methylobacterium radiotolerans]